ncbi:MAG TPA: ATP-binding protein [Clostridia bacterium]|nr:ATP-binding protein [Clostridia bacterium]
MDIKDRLKNKNKIVIATIISMVLIFIIFKIIYMNVTRCIYSQIEEKMIRLSEILVDQIDGNEHEQFIENNNAGSAFSRETNRLLSDVKEKFPEIVNIYTMVQTGNSDVWKVVLTTDTDMKNRMSLGKNQNLVAPGIYLGSVVGDTFVYKEKDNFISVYKPVYNSNKKQVAVLAMDVREDVTIEQTEKLLNRVWVFPVAIILAIGFISLMSMDEILKPVELLIKQSEEIKWGERLYFEEDIDGKLGLLIKEFNKILHKDRYRGARQRKSIGEVVEEKENIFGIYKEIIEVATQNKILLLSREAFIKKMSEDFPIYSTKLAETWDITRCRKEIDHVLAMKNPSWWNGKNRADILLCLSEAVTNAVKHAGSGEILLSVKNHKLTIYILDNGKGINLKELPDTIFTEGFSTKQASLGVGFSLMEKYMDKIILSTSRKGTFLALQKQICGENGI